MESVEGITRCESMEMATDQNELPKPYLNLETKEVLENEISLNPVKLVKSEVTSSQNDLSGECHALEAQKNVLPKNGISQNPEGTAEKVTSGQNEVSVLFLDLETKGEVTEDGSTQTSEESIGREVTTVKKKSVFNCLICGKKFNQNAGRYNHMKKIHNVIRGDKTNIRCLEKGCSFKCSYKEKLQLHLIEEHGFSMDVTIKTFTSYSEFLRWKEEFEKQGKTRFVKKSGSRSREKGVRVVYFYCSRSVTNINQNNLEKQICKRKSTTKSSHHCTASITCLELASGHVEVKICNTHYGHDTDLSQLRLTQTEKIQIVEQLVKGVPRDVVLDNIRSSASSEVDRIHFITIKDVKNIEKAYRIHSKNSNDTILSPNMTHNISHWVSLMSQSEHTPVLYFKEDGNSDWTEYDFTLVIMTLGQIEMARKYGQSKIFYIPTYATNDNKYFVYSPKAKNTYEIHIATLIVVDNSNNALPISFMISTKLSKDKYKLFFECVKQKVPELDAKFVLTDDNNDIYEAWKLVFNNDANEPPCHLWSNRFVDKDWRDNLIAIPNEEIQEVIYETLYSYLESPVNRDIGNALRDYAVNHLQEEPLTAQFGDHFAVKYLGYEPLWAGCYGKKNVAIHAQLNMERLSNEIEEVVDRKHLDKRFIVKTVQDLLKLISDKQCQRQAKVQRQIQELPNHHKLGLKINPEAILKETPSSWRVNSSKDPENIFSIVTKQDERACNVTPCPLFCTNCGTCAHEFKCSCRLYAFDKTMCKHIHAVIITFFDQTHFLAHSEAEDSMESIEKDLTKLKNDILWGRRRRKKVDLPTEKTMDPPTERTVDLPTERTVDPPTERTVDPLAVEEDNLLPVLDEIIHNKKSTGTKRKRGRPRKTEELSEDTNTVELLDEKAEISHRSKVNILKKRKKTSPFKCKINTKQRKSSKGQ